MKSVNKSNRFKKEFARQIKRGKSEEKLYQVLEYLVLGKDLPTRYRPHKFSGEYIDLWECHIGPDWLLIYTFDDTTVFLKRTGTHSDLF